MKNGISDRHEQDKVNDCRDLRLAVVEPPRCDEINSQYVAMVESAFDGILTASLDGTIHTWNPACERIFGYKFKDAIGRSLGMLVPPDRANEDISALQQLSAGATVNLETERVRRDGTLVDVLLDLSPIKDRQGQVVTFVAVIHDLGDRNRADQRIKDGQSTLVESR